MNIFIEYLPEIGITIIALYCVYLYFDRKQTEAGAAELIAAATQRTKDVLAELNSVSAKYNVALKTIKEKREANLILIDQLANVVSFNLITNTEPKPNASPEYYKLSDKNKHYFFTPHEVNEAHQRALKNPEDTANS